MNVIDDRKKNQIVELNPPIIAVASFKFIEIDLKHKVNGSISNVPKEIVTM